MALASTSVHVVDGALQMAASSVCVPRVSSAASDPGSFQIIASALGPEACEILYAPFKHGLCFPQPSGSPKLKPCWLQIQKFWEILFM